MRDESLRFKGDQGFMPEDVYMSEETRNRITVEEGEVLNLYGLNIKIKDNLRINEFEFSIDYTFYSKKIKEALRKEAMREVYLNASEEKANKENNKRFSGGFFDMMGGID